MTLEEFKACSCIDCYIKLSALCSAIVQSPVFNGWMVVCILIAGAVPGVESYPDFKDSAYIWWADIVVFVSFASEIILKVISEQFTPWKFFTNNNWRWNWFDCFVVLISLPVGTGGSIEKLLKLFRLARLARFSKLFSAIPQLNNIVTTLMSSVPFVGGIVLLWFMMIYLYGILGVIIFANNDPWHFGSIEYAVLSLFQVTVMDVSR